MSYERLNDWSLSVSRLIAGIDSPQLLRTLIDELGAATRGGDDHGHGAGGLGPR